MVFKKVDFKLSDKFCDGYELKESWDQHNQLNCLFQIMYYQMFNGARKTPLHVSFGQYQYSKSRSREILTVANRIGVSSSYNDVRRSRCLLASYAIEKSAGKEISNFPVTSYKIHSPRPLIVDFSDRSSASGMNSDHVTMQVLYHESMLPPGS